MKIPMQEKIAELEQRIIALETQWRRTSTSQPLTPTQEGHLRRMWIKFDEMFSELGKVFR